MSVHCICVHFTICFSLKYRLKPSLFFMQQVTMIHLPAEKACYVANSVDKTPTPAVLKEALETVSEIELLPHLGFFTVSLAMFWRV